MRNELLQRVMDKLEAIPDVAVNLGVAYVGAKSTRHWSGALTGLIALKLAQAPNLLAGAVGIGMLTFLGLTAFAQDLPQQDYTYTPATSVNVSGVGAGGGGYVPPASDLVTMDTSDCIAQGGTVVSVVPMTTLCSCRLPPPPPPPPPKTGGGSGGTSRR